MTTKKTPAVKKAPKAKVEPTVDTTVQNDQNDADVVAAAPTRKKRVEIERNEMIPCRSATEGELIYKSSRTNALYIWKDIDTVLDLEMGELMDIQAYKPAYLNDVYFVVEDEEAAEYLRLNEIYENLVDVDDIFEMSFAELETILPKLPKALRESVGTKARKLVEAEELDSRKKIKLIEEKLGIDLKLFIKD